MSLVLAPHFNDVCQNPVSKLFWNSLRALLCSLTSVLWLWIIDILRLFQINDDWMIDIPLKQIQVVFLGNERLPLWFWNSISEIQWCNGRFYVWRRSAIFMTNVKGAGQSEGGRDANASVKMIQAGRPSKRSIKVHRWWVQLVSLALEAAFPPTSGSGWFSLVLFISHQFTIDVISRHFMHWAGGETHSSFRLHTV